jgi:hypothetical protein
MVKLNLRSPLVIAGVSFLLIWYAVMHQRVNSREHLTDVKPIPNASKEKIIQYMLLKVVSEEQANKIKLTPDDKKFIAFLEANPITAVDDKMMVKLTEMIKKISTNDVMMKQILSNPDLAKNGVRAVGQAAVAAIIFLYADRYEKLKEPPTQDQFKAQMNSLFLDDPTYKHGIRGLRANLDNEDEYKDNISDSTRQIAELDNELKSYRGYPAYGAVEQRNNQRKQQIQQRVEASKMALDGVTIQKSVLGVNTYPFGASTSPLVNQVFEIAYKYYFGETYTGAGLFSAAWKAIIGIFGATGAILVIGLLVYYFFLR